MSVPIILNHRGATKSTIFLKGEKLMNESIKKELRANNIPLWRCALAAGISEQTLIRWLRVELHGERRERVEAAVKMLLEGGK